MENFENYLVAVVMLICLCIGYVIKHVFQSNKLNRFIPAVMAALGVALNVWLCGFEFTPEILLGGLASGLASTGMHQALKQFIAGKNTAGEKPFEKLEGGESDE